MHIGRRPANLVSAQYLWQLLLHACCFDKRCRILDTGHREVDQPMNSAICVGIKIKMIGFPKLCQQDERCKRIEMIVQCAAARAISKGSDPSGCI